MSDHHHRGPSLVGGPLRLLRREETALEHIRNALALVRVTFTTAEPVIGNDGPGFIVPAATLDAIQRRLEAAWEALEVEP